MNRLYILAFFILLIQNVKANDNLAVVPGPTVKGAASEKELSTLIFEAIKNNQFESLQNYIPAENELEYLRATSTEKNKPLFENLQPDKLNVYTRRNFDLVIQKGIENNINWSSTQLIDYQTRQCSIEKIGCKVFITIQDAVGKSVSLSYDIININDKWFLFQGMRTES
ncbi:MAG TPA: hypothetical protein VF691_02755 [Cytophagaceae bacterium]|jgi:hypothetical protein